MERSYEQSFVSLWEIFEFKFYFLLLMLMKRLMYLRPHVKSLLLLSLRYKWKIEHEKDFCFLKILVIFHRTNSWFVLEIFKSVTTTSVYLKAAPGRGVRLFTQSFYCISRRLLNFFNAIFSWRLQLFFKQLISQVAKLSTYSVNIEKVLHY